MQKSEDDLPKVVEALRAKLAVVNNALSDVGSPWCLEWVVPDTLVPAPKNARYMNRATHAQLMKNVAMDGALESVPLCACVDGRHMIISGHHRIDAAKDAGLDGVLIMVLNGPLTRSEFVAKQLSHNAIAGQDDQRLLAELWTEIDSIEHKMYSGLNDTAFVADCATLGFPSAQLYYKEMRILFVSEVLDEVKGILKEIDTKADETLVARLTDFEPVFQALLQMKRVGKIQNTAVAFAQLALLCRRYLDETRNKTPKTEQKC